MLLALWADFWNLADWVPAPPPVVIPEPTEGGHGHYQPRRDHEWWDEYETMLRRFHPAEVEEDAPVAVKRAAKERNRLIAKARTHHPPSIESLRAVNAKIEALTLQIDEYALQSADEDALLALILS